MIPDKIRHKDIDDEKLQRLVEAAEKLKIFAVLLSVVKLLRR